MGREGGSKKEGRKKGREGRERRKEKNIIEGKRKSSTLLKYDLALHIRKKSLKI